MPVFHVRSRTSDGKSLHREAQLNGFDTPVVPTQYVISTSRAMRSSEENKVADTPPLLLGVADNGAVEEETRSSG